MVILIDGSTNGRVSVNPEFVSTIICVDVNDVYRKGHNFAGDKEIISSLVNEVNRKARDSVVDKQTIITMSSGQMVCFDGDVLERLTNLLNWKTQEKDQ